MAIRSKSINKVLAMKDKVSQELTATAVDYTSMPDTTGSLPIYDESGKILGYIALYSNADLT